MAGAGEPETLEDYLNAYTVPILKKLAGLLSPSPPTRKAELVAFIRQEMEDPDRLREVWGRMDELQQAAVAEALYSPSRQLDSAMFRAKYGRDPDWGQRDRYGQLEDPSYLSLLLYRGALPRDLAEHLRAFVPPPRRAEARAGDELPDTVLLKSYTYTRTGAREKYTQVPLTRRETEQMALHDVHAVLRLVETGKVRVSDRTKQVTAASARAIAEVLEGGDFYPLDEEPKDQWHTVPGPIRAFAWPLILQSAGLAEVAGTKLQLTPAGRKALSSPPHEVIRRAWDRWLKATILDEFSRIHTIKGQRGKGRRSLTAVAGRRQTIAQALAACPPHKWIALDEFSRFMRASGFRFEVARDLWHLYIEDPNYGSLGYSGFGEWHIVQGRYIMAFLFEYAATMGIVDVAYIHPSGARNDYRDLWGTDDMDCLSRYDGLMYIRINALGAWCLGQTPKYVPSVPSGPQMLRVLPNMDVVAMAPLPPGDALFLERFSEKTSDAVWRIQPTRLLEAVEGGPSVAEVQAFLEAKSGGPLPDNVAVFFQETAERTSRLVHRGPALLIEAQDPALAQLIANDRELRSLCMLAGERYIVVPADNEGAFRRALHKLGYALPAR